MAAPSLPHADPTQCAAPKRRSASKLLKDMFVVTPAQGGGVMTYSIFSTDVPLPSGKVPNLLRMVPVHFDSMGSAIVAACKLMSDGAIVWKIGGRDGFVMEREDVETEYRRRKIGIQA